MEQPPFWCGWSGTVWGIIDPTGGLSQPAGASPGLNGRLCEGLVPVLQKSVLLVLVGDGYERAQA